MKKIEDMNHYEILDIKRMASQDEIKNAYFMGKFTYGPDSISFHGLLSEEERKNISAKLEKAYRTLINPEKRREYDSKLPRDLTAFKKKSIFRQTTEKLIIEDARAKKRIVTKGRRKFMLRKGG